jgi:hypothetical protein
VRQVVGLLEREGILYRRERRGTFVRSAIVSREQACTPPALRCINFVEQSVPIKPAHASSDYLAGYTQALEHYDVKMRFMGYADVQGSWDGMLSAKYPFREQGCILVNVVTPELAQWLNERQIPFVVQYYLRYTTDGLPKHHAVFINKTGGGFDAARHLLDLGHRRIGFVGWLPGRHRFSRVHEGYAAALACAGLAPAPEDLLDFSTDEPGLAAPVMRAFLSRPDRPTAMVTESDSTALGALMAARALGIRVPGELSIVGFNDQAEAAASDPPLTTISSPRRLLARRAVEMLIEAAAGEGREPRTEVLNCRLVVRATTAPPAARAQD